MKFYAYVPTQGGGEPTGTTNRTMFELKTLKGAIERCRRLFKRDDFVLQTYTNFYDNKTFKTVKDMYYGITGTGI